MVLLRIYLWITQVYYTYTGWFRYGINGHRGHGDQQLVEEETGRAAGQYQQGRRIHEYRDECR